MGNKSKKRQNHFDLGEAADDYRNGSDFTSQSNAYGERDRGRNRDLTSAIRNDGEDDEISEGQESPDVTDLEIDQYLAVVEDLRMKLDASQMATETALVFYGKHQAEIQKVDTTREQLKQMTEKCSDYRIVINNLQQFEGEKERELARKKAAIDEDRRKLDSLKEQATKYMQKLEEEKREFENTKITKEAKQVLKLQEKKAELEREHNKRYDERVADLEKAIKKSQDDDKKKITDLQSRNDELVKDVEEQRRRLKDAEKRCKDVEKLRSLSETEVEDLSQKLKMALNEFGLCASTSEYFKSEFLKMQSDVQSLSYRYVKEIKIDDLDAAIHDKIEKVDEDFASVPISNTVVSQELCFAHFQRVISSQLRAIFWQPFSSEMTVQDSQQTLLLNQIYDSLAKSSHEGKSGFRAARTFAVLALRSLHSQSTSTKRAELFTENTMKILSLLVSPKIHPVLRKDLTHLATSAISLWNTVQMDEREIQVHPSLDPASFQEPEDKDIASTDSRVFVLFPRVTARKCAQTDNAHSVGLPGGWLDSEPEVQLEEICFHEGNGVPEWGQLVRAGEDEEENRRKEKKRRELEEEMEKLNKRGSIYGRRNSVVVGKSATSNPTAAWLGAQKIPERE
ncbi:hypothetical protein GLAREA_07285 [Glarea lozoyensis ATCC 20868]|uniref:Uncharacterized protein n=1 Tax=Glarea lozoyensis (strain ATCC 20868 / MF5171) TaxID=1116229 RepID=S3D0U7_GLAL2|nr:uncharacterized protein GLAREA_07285 [Glarea lozoyensis ATCC 20868]EPE32152.1 hypothetical protein GLAREA_07285 [Glarea lozoyensis ATCC 20868]